MAIEKTYEELASELQELRLQLLEATDTIDAIRTGGVDALVVMNGQEHQVYTLKSADQTYRVFIEKMNEGAITLNKDGLIVYCNSSFAKMMEMPLTKVVGHHFIDFIPAEMKATFNEIIDDAWDAEDKGEIALIKEDGSLIHFLFSLTTLELDEGTALSIILADLSLQKENELQLKEKNRQLEDAKLIMEKLNNELEDKVQERTKELSQSREQFKFLADNIPVIAWTAQPDGSVTYFNKRWYEYTGNDEKNYDLATWMDVVHPDDKEEAARAWKEATDNATPYTIEYRFKRGEDKTYRWHYGHALPYKNEQGGVQAWFGISTDIDQQKKQLEKKDEFISMVSHELKTPVTSLKGFTQLLMATLRGIENPMVHEYLGTMNNQITKLTRLISDLLDATKFNAGQLKFDEEMFDFNTLAEEVCKEMQLTTDKHEIILALGEPVSISGDRNRIGQVIINLISNAIKYSPNASKVLVSSEKHGDHIQFCVKDFGIGISKIEQPKLYTRFFRAAETKGNTFPGMGLGLYISMGIIEKHKGSMRVESEANKGAEFYFTLPLAEQEQNKRAG